MEEKKIDKKIQNRFISDLNRNSKYFNKKPENKQVVTDSYYCYKNNCINSIPSNVNMSKYKIFNGKHDCQNSGCEKNNYKNSGLLSNWSNK